MAEQYDLVVLGSGPGGYVAAIRGAQLGMQVAVIERAELGGICLNWGCIPTKALLKSGQILNDIQAAEKFGIHIEGTAQPNFEAIITRSREVAARMSKGIEYLFKKNNITVIQGEGKLKDTHTLTATNEKGEITDIQAKNIILATGARARELPGLAIDGKKIIGYRQALTLPKLPESLLVIGSGAIGTELAFFYNSMGVKVTIVEFLPNVVPLEDEDVSKQLARELKKRKIEVMLSSSVTKVDIFGNLCRVTIDTPKGTVEREAEIVLSAVGIAANIENIGLETIGIKTEKGKIVVDEYYHTNIQNIYAIGDIIDTPALAHVASAEAITCVEKIAGQSPVPVDYNNIPSAVYTTPEVASVGLTEKAVQDKGIEYRIGKFPFTASGKATAVSHNEGFVKLIFDKQTDKLLGAHLIGYNVTEMIAELVVSKKLNGTAKDLIKSIHPHPTMSEAIMEAAAAAHDEVIHL